MKTGRLLKNALGMTELLSLDNESFKKGGPCKKAFLVLVWMSEDASF